MPWDDIRLNDGREIPSIAFGTSRLGNGPWTIDTIDQAIWVGFSHIDTAQIYGNEADAGAAIRESGLKREEIWVTTKYSGVGGLSIREAFNESLNKLGITFVDLYLIHFPKVALPDIPTAWKEMERLHAEGLAKSIGVSNFQVDHLAILLASAKVKPAVNQILFHPYVYLQTLPTLEYCTKHGITIEAYSALTPITKIPNGSVAQLVAKIAQTLGPDVTPDQVLLAWTKRRLGAGVIVTQSSKKSRLEGYIAAGDLVLSDEDMTAIDEAGVKDNGARRRLLPGVPEWRAVILGVFGVIGFTGAIYRYMIPGGNRHNDDI